MFRRHTSRISQAGINSAKSHIDACVPVVMTFYFFLFSWIFRLNMYESTAIHQRLLMLRAALNFVSVFFRIYRPRHCAENSIATLGKRHSLIEIFALINSRCISRKFERLLVWESARKNFIAPYTLLNHPDMQFLP